jgi:uncharacterized membrane protein (DUF441 family)
VSLNEFIASLFTEGRVIVGLLIIGILLFTGSVASPITDTNAKVTALEREIKKLVRLQAVMCTSLAKAPADCALALTDTPQPQSTTVTVVK